MKSKALLLVVLLCSFASAQTPRLSTVRVYKYSDEPTLHGHPSSYGSGVLVTLDYILTNHHVVSGRREGTENIQVRFNDGWRTWAAVEFEDEDLDLALVKVNRHKTIKPMEMGNNASKGEVVVAYGFGYDYEYKMFVGIVGNKMKRVACIDPRGVCAEEDPGGGWFVLHGASVRGGDSGGPVVRGNKIVGLMSSTGSNYSMCLNIESIRKILIDRLTKGSLRGKVK